MISQEAFEEKYNNMPPKRRKVLEALLAGKTDKEIIDDEVLGVSYLSTVRKHISLIYKDFDIEPNGYNCRDELIEIINRYKPELVDEQVLIDCGLPSSHLELLKRYILSAHPLKLVVIRKLLNQQR